MNGNAMHVFLTGEIQVGKSTLIRRVLAALPDVRTVGFRTVTAADLPEQPSRAVTDVSFISLKLILPPMAAVLEPGGEIVSLIKPQFEAGRDQVPGGVVRDEAVRQAVVEDIRRFGTEVLRLTWLGCVPSPLKGPEGNVEFLAYWKVA